MGALFSILTKQFLGIFLISAGVPAIALVVGVRALVVPQVPVVWSTIMDTGFLGPEWQAGLLVVAFLVVVSLLVSLNGPITRLYEGYPLQRSRLGEWLRRRHETRVREAETWWNGTRTILRTIDRLDADPRPDRAAPDLAPERIAELDTRWNRVGQLLPRKYPKPYRVLPTRLGNTMRAFEDYPRHKYGMYAVTLWPRLLTVVDARDVERIGSGKQPLDFMINSSLVSGILALLVLTTGLLWPEHQQGAVAWWTWGTLVSTLTALAYAFYRLSIPPAMAWGETVKAMFDVYRWRLLDRLEIAERPDSMDRERQLWFRIGGHMLFGRKTTYGPLRYTRDEPPTESVHENGG
ncbi:MAG: hypothetical protein PVG07_03080 [Acidobacteriota bacterium]|jgi:hypothetical protein